MGCRRTDRMRCAARAVCTPALGRRRRRRSAELWRTPGGAAAWRAAVAAARAERSAERRRAARQRRRHPLRRRSGRAGAVEAYHRQGRTAHPCQPAAREAQARRPGRGAAGTRGCGRCPRARLRVRPVPETRRRRLQQAGAPEAPLGTRARLSLTHAPVSLGQTAGRAMLAGPIGLAFDTGASAVLSEASRLVLSFVSLAMRASQPKPCRTVWSLASPRWPPLLREGQ